MGEQTPNRESPMSRRPVVLLVLVVSSFVIAACSETSIAAPRRDDPVDSTGLCKSGVWVAGRGCVTG